MVVAAAVYQMVTKVIKEVRMDSVMALQKWTAVVFDWLNIFSCHRKFILSCFLGFILWGCWCSAPQLGSHTIWWSWVKLGSFWGPQSSRFLESYEGGVICKPQRLNGLVTGGAVAGVAEETTGVQGVRDMFSQCHMQSLDSRLVIHLRMEVV